MDPARPSPDGLVVEGAVGVRNGRIDWVGLAPTSPPMPAPQRPSTPRAYSSPRARRVPHTPGVLRRPGGRVRVPALGGQPGRERRRAGGCGRAPDRAVAGRRCDHLRDQDGHGLDIEAERRILNAASRVGEALPVRVSPPSGAHTVPREYDGRPDAHVDLVCYEMIPAVAAKRLADAGRRVPRAHRVLADADDPRL
jgi:hypothetical protein